MGIGRSKQFPISYEEACSRVSREVLTRLEDTFKRTSSASGYLPQTTFARDIMGEGVPPKLAEGIYHAFGGSQKGIGFKDMVCGLVLLAHGTVEEKAKFLAQMLALDGHYITKETVQDLISACDRDPSPVDMETLFLQEPYCTAEFFENWIKSHTNLASFSKWFLETKETGFQLEAEPDPPTFYQTLADLHGLTEKDVMDLEKTYWGLRGSGKFDQEVFEGYTCPPVPKELCEGLFNAFDINCDGHIDLSEVVSAVAICCRKPEEERHKLWFQVFDQDQDRLLSRAELTRAVGLLLQVQEENRMDSTSNHTPLGGSREEGGVAAEGETGTISQPQATSEAIVEAALSNHAKEHEGSLTEEEYLQWAVGNTLSQELSKVLFQICHVKFGLRPRNRKDEATVVDGYLLRFKKAERKTGDTVYLIAAQWFTAWREHTHNELSQSSRSKKNKRDKKKHKAKSSQPQVHSYSVTPVIPVADTADKEMVEVAEEALELITVANEPPGGGRASAVSSESEASVTAEGDAGPGPIDNSVLCVPDPSGNKKLPSLTNEGGRLKQSQLLVEGNDFFLLPEMVWRVFILWYGSVGYSWGPALPRLVRDDGRVELYPVFFKIYRHTTLPPPVKPTSFPWPLSAIFNTLGLAGMGGGAAHPATPLISGGSDSNPTQPPLPRRVSYYQAAFDKKSTILEISEQLQKLLHMKAEDLRLYDFSAEDDPAILDDESATIESLRFGDGQKLLVETRNKDNTWPEEMIAIIKEVQAKAKDKEKAKTQHDAHVPPGATGLSNLGNTCFMNSALQCVSSAQPLTCYFKEKDYLLEINKDNPLGMGGVIAKRYAELIQDLWSGHSKSITPLKFRFTVGRYAPRFNGFQQQDSQELLAFVLDGLHEDLNRVKEKPYKELKDSDGRPDEEVAQEAWDYHLSRNQSVIVDLFHGQLKSVVRCKVCDYESMRFDPFTFLSLPLPVESTVDLEVTVVRLDGSQPVRYGLKLEIDERYRLLKENLSQLCGIPSSTLLLVEIVGSMIRNFPSDTTKIRSVLGGYLFAFELPDPSILEPTSRSESPDEIFRKQKVAQLRRERTLSMRKAQDERERAARARARRDERRRREEEEGRSRETSPEAEGAESLSLDGELSANLTPDLPPEEQTDDATQKREEIKPLEPEEDPSPRRHPERNPRATPTPPLMEGNPITTPIPPLVEGDLRTPPTPPLSDSRGIEDTDEVINDLAGEALQQTEERLGESSAAPPWGAHGGFIFAVHRRIFPTDHYFVSCQKNRPALFGMPLVIPCTAATSGREVYQLVWNQIQRLIIPDPPNAQTTEQERRFPFQLKWVNREGFSCATCPWYKFCRGCLLECDDAPMGSSSRYIAVDWDLTTLHLKYQQAKEKPIEHESMESLKTINTDPIDLYDCFKAFVQEDQLGEDECWYCKHCEKHQEAVKSLEIWRLPPILIVHLKRFQFFNGRWVKSQRVVTFPANLEPKRYTVANGNGELGTVDQEPDLTRTDTASADQAEVYSHEESRSEDQSHGSQGEVPVNQPISESRESPDGAVALQGQGEAESGPSSRPNIYDLFAISCHAGILGGGHYTSFTKNPNGKWYYFNDSSCKETTEERVLQESPYLLFFELQGLKQQDYRAKKQGKRQDITSSEDDREFEETLKSLRKHCCVQ